MRDRFPWYFIEEKDLEAIWTKGTLTVDTNVILDLYRYNITTREALLGALESFKGRFWISHQTSKEFIKNRRVVISDMKNDFEKALKPVNEVEKETRSAISAIRACRVIPRELGDAFEKSLQYACVEIRESIEKERLKVPDFEHSDDIVKRLEVALDDNIGDPPANIENDIKEAQRRRELKIPPGYMDSGKEGAGFSGDYLMWIQILSYCKDKQVPMILVTSETKEDWWENKSGKTLNPRLELLQEAFEFTSQKFLIYHTDQFLKLHQKRSGGEADESILKEIREYTLAREAAVRVAQEVDTSDLDSNNGILKVSVVRSVKNFTASGRFYPKMSRSPNVNATLTDCPSGTPNVAIRANTGTNFDFNVHVHSRDHGRELPVGEYIIEYEALVAAKDIASEGEALHKD